MSKTEEARAGVEGARAEAVQAQSGIDAARADLGDSLAGRKGTGIRPAGRVADKQ